MMVPVSEHGNPKAFYKSNKRMFILADNLSVSGNIRNKGRIEANGVMRFAPRGRDSKTVPTVLFACNRLRTGVNRKLKWLVQGGN
jgi:hypothetical protein